MLSRTTVVSQVQSEPTINILSKTEKLQRFIENKQEQINEIEQKLSILKYKIYEPTGPFIDWLINLVIQLIELISFIIDFIKILVFIEQLIELLSIVVNQLIDLINQFIEWIIDLFSPNLNTNLLN
jgi:hypothetical protein